MLKPGTVGLMLVSALEVVLDSLPFVAKIVPDCSGSLSYVASYATIAVILFLFTRFITSFGDRADTRSIFASLSFAFINVVFLISTFACVYTVTSIGYTGDDGKSYTTNDVGACAYFSVVTFTTLGYGDFHPVSSGARAAVSIEALIGYIVLALLVSALTPILRRPSPSK